MDKIFLKNLKLKTKIGLFDWEKQIDQIISNQSVSSNHSKPQGDLNFIESVSLKH